MDSKKEPTEIDPGNTSPAKPHPAHRFADFYRSMNDFLSPTTASPKPVSAAVEPLSEMQEVENPIMPPAAIPFDVIVRALANNTKKLDIVDGNGKRVPRSFTRLIEELRPAIVEMGIAPHAFSPQALQELCYFLLESPIDSAPNQTREDFLYRRGACAKAIAQNYLHPDHPDNFHGVNELAVKLETPLLRITHLYQDALDEGLVRIEKPEKFIQLENQPRPEQPKPPNRAAADWKTRLASLNAALKGTNPEAWVIKAQRMLSRGDQGPEK